MSMRCGNVGTTDRRYAAQRLVNIAEFTNSFNWRIFTCRPARRLNPKAADIPSIAAGVTPAVMHAALHPSLRTKALACGSHR